MQVSSGFQGCVRSLSLNGAALDLRSPASHHNVTSCFASDQAGSYFNGSGYAVLGEWPTNQEVGSYWPSALRCLSLYANLAPLVLAP